MFEETIFNGIEGLERLTLGYLRSDPPDSYENIGSGLPSQFDDVKDFDRALRKACEGGHLDIAQDMIHTTTVHIKPHSVHQNKLV